MQSRSDGVNTSLCGKREHIEKLHRTRNLLRKVQVICQLFEGKNCLALSGLFMGIVEKTLLKELRIFL